MVVLDIPMESSAILPSAAGCPSAFSGTTRFAISNPVIQGIRDMGYWTHKVGRMIQREGAATNCLFATVTASYGYFPLLPFLLPSRRRQKLHWLVDPYVAAKAAYPNAEF